LCLLLAAFIVPNQAEAAVVSFKVKGASAGVTGLLTDPSDPCIQNFFNVFATDGRVKEGGGKPGTVSDISLLLFRFNTCTGELVLDVFASAPLSDEALQVQQLKSATLNTTVEACDFVSGSCFPVDIALTWTGTGDVRNEKNKSQSDTGSCKFRFTATGSFRYATASGSITALGINFIPVTVPSNSAQLSETTQGSATINCD
jgi:hypothetical protein